MARTTETAGKDRAGSRNGVGDTNEIYKCTSNQMSVMVK